MKILQRPWSKEKTQNQYRNLAGIYDWWSFLTESEAARKVLELAEIEDGQSIVEIACGTGIVFEQIVKQNPNGKNLGIDLSPHMLNKAKKRLKKHSPGNYDLKLGNVLQLDMDDLSFDRLINNFMIDLMPEDTFDKIAQTYYQLLNPDGIAVISNFSFGKKKINKFWYVLAKYWPGLLTGCRPVTFSEPLEKVGFNIEEHLHVSQNSFPAEVIKARK